MEMEGDGSEAVDGLKPKAARSPTSPTAEKTEEHEMIGHSVHRSWCGHCMMARGLMEQHRQAKHERAVPTLCLDYFFYGEENGCLTCKDDRSGMCWASPIPAKGNDAFAVNFVLGILDEVGYNRLI